jgi:hypothetical protein
MLTVPKTAFLLNILKMLTASKTASLLNILKTLTALKAVSLSNTLIKIPTQRYSHPGGRNLSDTYFIG